MKNPTKLALAALCGLSFLGPAVAQEAQPKIPAQIESDWMSDFSRNLWQGLTTTYKAASLSHEASRQRVCFDTLPTD